MDKPPYSTVYAAVRLVERVVTSTGRARRELTHWCLISKEYLFHVIGLMHVDHPRVLVRRDYLYCSEIRLRLAISRPQLWHPLSSSYMPRWV